MFTPVLINHHSFQNEAVVKTNKMIGKKLNENEKWVYFAVARKWRKVESGLFRK